MNPKFYSILFSALLASTFVHEINSKAAPAARPALAPAAVAEPKLLERAAEIPANCTSICSEAKSTNLSILANVDANLLAIVNLTANVGIIIDIDANLVVLLNGNTGAAIVLILSTNEVLYIAAGVWLSVRVSFVNYLKSLTVGLSVFLKISIGIKYSVSQVPVIVLGQINVILIFLIVNISCIIQSDATVGLQLIIAIVTKKIQLLTGSIKGYTKVVGSSIISIKADLAAILNIYEGLAIICGNVSGGLTALIKLGISLDLQLFANLTNGLDRLVAIIIAIGVKIDIGVVLGSLLNDVEAVFYLIALLGGNGNSGLTGLFKVLATIISCTKKKVSIVVVINVVILFLAYTSQTVSEDLTIVLKVSLKALLVAIGKAGATKSLSRLVVTITALIEGTLIIGGCNLSNIITILLTGVLKGAAFLLQVLILVIFELLVIVESVLGILYCLLVLIFHCNSLCGIEILKALGISITIRIEIILGSIIRYIFLLVEIVIELFFGDLYGACIKLPIIGQIFIAFNIALKAASNGKYDLQDILNASTLISNLIRGLFQLLAKISFSVDATIIAQVKVYLEQCTSLNAYLGINVSVIIGVLL